MTRYTVAWYADAQDQLASIWIDAPDRNAVSSAADSLDRELATDPERKGRPVGDRLRVLHEPPLEVLFDVIEPDRLVRVLTVRRSDAEPDEDKRISGGNDEPHG